jgi:hypothetical protein
MQPARMLIVTGLVLVALGVLWLVGQKLGLGRLPGDFVVKRKNFGFYFPLASSLLISLLLTIVLNFFRK